MNILFVCTGNTCRSPMAETMMIELLKEKGITHVQVASAGTGVYTKTGASHNAIMAMGERGIDLSSHTSRSLDAGILSWADAVYTMTNSHREYIAQKFPSYVKKVNTLLEGDVSDPFGGDLSEYNMCADEIYRGILKILGGL